MSTSEEPLKDPEQQHPIPEVWRNTLTKIANAIGDGDYQLLRGIAFVPSLPPNRAKLIEQNLKDYGASLIYLPEDTWNTSACQWMGSYWDVLVDLFTAEEGASDLAISVRVRESGNTYSFDVLSVHVP